MIGKKVQLRSPEPEDVDIIYQLENNPDLWHLGDSYYPFSKFDIEHYVISTPKDIFKLNQLRLMIEKLSDRKVVGTIDLFNFQPVNRRAAIGLVVEAGERGNGYATDALQIVISYCFIQLNLHQVYAGIPENNKPSIRLFEACGFEHTGTQNDWVLTNGKWLDLFFYQLINPNATN